MSNNAYFILLILSRLRVATIAQLERICTGQCKTTSIYHHLRNLMDAGMVARLSHPACPFFVYAATDAGIKTIHGSSSVEFPSVRLVDLRHVATCSETMMEFCFRKNITGISLEHEFDPISLRRFCLGRSPDAIIQVSDSHGSREMAVEVETSRKADAARRQMLEAYGETFRLGLLCSAVIIVAGSKEIFEAYQRDIATLPVETESAVVLCSSPRLKELNTRIYGEPRNNPGNTPKFIRNDSGGVVRYVPLESTTYQGATPRYRDPVTDLVDKETSS